MSTHPSDSPTPDSPTPIYPLEPGMQVVWLAGPLLFRNDLQKLGLPGIVMLGASREKFGVNAPIKFGVAVQDDEALGRLALFYIEWHVTHPQHPLSDINGQAPSENERDWEEWVRRTMLGSRRL